jgi:DNA uptake protein ComE-like DNA-binding protein
MKMRRGFALLTALWTISLIGSLSAAVIAVASTSIKSAENRIAWGRAYWRAYGCARRTEAAANAALDSIEATRQPGAWRQLNESIAGASLLEGCDATLEAAGTRVDVNSASNEMLERVFETLGAGVWSQDLAATVVSARDSEPIVDLRELAIDLPAEVSRDSLLHGLEVMLSVERGRISLATASAPVLATVPGFTRETADALVARRQANGPIRDLSDLLPLLSSAARSALVDEYRDAQRVTTTEPDAWMIRSVAIEGTRAVPVELRWRLVRRGRSVEVTDGWVVR